MAAITANSVVRESVGSLTLLIVSLTMGSTQDTYTVSSNLQVVDAWAQAQIGSTSTSAVDVSYSSGTFTLSTVTNYGATKLFILCRA